MDLAPVGHENLGSGPRSGLLRVRSTCFASTATIGDPNRSLDVVAPHVQALRVSRVSPHAEHVSQGFSSELANDSNGLDEGDGSYGGESDSP